MTTKDWMDSLGFYDETTTDRVSIAAYGETKSGKTTFAGTFPKPFFIDTDRGGRTLKKLHIPHISIPPYDRTFDLINDILIKLRQKEPPFDKLEVETLVFDSVTALADFLIYDLLLHPLEDENVGINGHAYGQDQGSQMRQGQGNGNQLKNGKQYAAVDEQG